MNAIKIKRKIYSPQITIEELKDFIGKNVEITVIEEIPEERNKSRKTLVGILSAYKDKSKIGSEKEAWKTAVNDKYGNR